MKLLGGIVLLCLSITWAVFWCAQLSDPLIAFYTDYQAIFVLVASLALIPLIWATSLLDKAMRAPLAPAAAPKWCIALPVQKAHIERKAEGEDQPAGLAPDAPILPELLDASVADQITEIKSPTPAAA